MLNHFLRTSPGEGGNKLGKEISPKNIAHYPKSVRSSVEIKVKYSGYIKRQNEKIEQFKRLEGMLIPADIDYSGIQGISSEAREKLIHIRPESVGQLSRISGIKPADVTNLLYYIRKVYRSKEK